MERARRAAVTALLIALLLSGTAVPAPIARPASAIGPLAVTTWPVSALVVSEVLTGGLSASDEFVEIANQGPLAVDLMGLEVAYATSTGATVTRKASWPTTQVLEPGRRVLLANALGVYASLADTTYSGGLASTGGALVLRPIGGEPIDAVGWGDAVNAYVEGAAAAAPPALSAIERRPGGAAGNATDTNANADDWFVQPAPSPQGLSATPIPGPSPTPVPTASGTPTPQPTAPPSGSPEPTATTTPSPGPSTSPSTLPTPSVSPEPTLTPIPTQTPDPTATPNPSPVVTTIGDARALPDGAIATVAGVLTTPLGVFEDGRTAYLEDPTGGIALYLDAPVVGTLAAGTTIQVAGSIDERFAQRTLRIAQADVLVTGSAAVPEAVTIATGAAAEAAEGRRIRVAGTTAGSATPMADGFGLFVDDGSGQLRVIVTPDVLGALDVPAGTLLGVAGSLGQRDSSGTGAEGYRLLVANPGDLTVLPIPTPTPTASGSPAPSEAPGPTSSPSPTSSPTTPRTIVEARALAVGARVTVEGIVTAEAGRLGLPELLAIQDPTGGIVVRLGDGMSPPARGTRTRLSGTIADPYGQTELRLTDTAPLTVGTGPLPTPLQTQVLTDRIEGRLVTVHGVLTATPRRSSSQDLTLDLQSGERAIRVMADASAGLQPGKLIRGATYRVTGVVSQRASRKGALDGYRAWLRDTRDVVLVSRPTPGPTSRPSDGPGQGIPRLTIKRALQARDVDVAVEGVVTAGANLLDTTGRRIVIQDATAAVEVLVPVGAKAPGIGTRLRVTGEIGEAYGAPRLRADEIRSLGRAGTPTPIQLRGSPTAAYEWRLARVSGDVADVRRLGSRWQAELTVGSQRILVDGLPGSRIPSTALTEGRRATVIGLVRRPYPTATDRRFSIVPRKPGDLKSMAGDGPSPSGPPGGGDPGSSGPPSASPAPTPDGAPDVDLRDLGVHVGETVRVGGLIVALETDGVVLDDGTGTGRIVLRDAALAYLPLLDPGDAINATGRVEAADSGPVVVVSDPAGLVRSGDLDRAGALANQDRSFDQGSPTDAGIDAATTAFGDPFGMNLPGLATLASLALVTLASVAVTLLRRERLRRRLSARVAARLAAVVGAPNDQSMPAERAG